MAAVRVRLGSGDEHRSHACSSVAAMFIFLEVSTYMQVSNLLGLSGYRSACVDVCMCGCTYACVDVCIDIHVCIFYQKEQTGASTIMGGIRAQCC